MNTKSGLAARKRGLVGFLVILVYFEIGREVVVNRVADMESLEASWVADTAEDSLCHREHLGMAQCVIDDKRPRDIQPDQSDSKEVRS